MGSVGMILVSVVQRSPVLIIGGLNIMMGLLCGSVADCDQEIVSGKIRDE
jgi:hypothetical protein